MTWRDQDEPFPHHIFTEPADANPDTLANLGPLRRLAGRWKAQKGMDINPKATAPEYRFRTDSYEIDTAFDGDDAWSYDIRTMLLVHGRPDPFDIMTRTP